MRRGTNRSGTLLVATGIAWFAGSVAPAALYVHRGVLVHLLVRLSERPAGAPPRPAARRRGVPRRRDRAARQQPGRHARRRARIRRRRAPRRLGRAGGDAAPLAALPELAGRATVAVELHVDGPRCPAAAEAAAYFVCG
jgi:hypothetical protein